MSETPCGITFQDVELMKTLERSDTGQGYDVDTNEGVEAWKVRGPGIRPVYELRKAGCDDREFDTAAGLVVAWIREEI